MGIFNIFKQKSDEDRTRVFMKSACFGTVGSISTLLTRLNYNRLIVTCELTVFASFIVTAAYAWVKNLNGKNLLVSDERLDDFHLDVLNDVINKGLEEKIIKDENEVLKFREEFYDLTQTRYLEYWSLFGKDISDVFNPNMKDINIFGFNVLNNFLKHLFVEPINETELPSVLIPLSLELCEIYIDCTKYFKHIKRL